jgi:hypothetical protein
LEQGLAEASAHVEALRQELPDDPGGASRREEAARTRAAEERRPRVARALEQVPALEERRKKRGIAGPARVSTTDPDARVMKRADGGFRPAFNGQFTTATASQVGVGVDVHNAGSDGGQLLAMARQVQRRDGRGPAAVLADGGVVALDDLRALAEPALGCTVYAPPMASGGPPAQRQRNDAAIAAWRRRMETAEAKRIYTERAATAECVNAIARHRGLQRFVVRGMEKVRAVLLWFALAHHLMRAVTLRHAAGATP